MLSCITSATDHDPDPPTISWELPVSAPEIPTLVLQEYRWECKCTVLTSTHENATPNAREVVERWLVNMT